MVQQDEKTKEALWSAVRALEENAVILRRVGGRARRHNHESLATRVESKAAAEQQSKLVREVIARNNFKGSA
ncbi:MAG TPA: hypothetical protein VFM35_06930 [Candidatus Binatia bacterium]|nr:hypothetical protein [Candidatus Binatia bacterium]